MDSRQYSQKSCTCSYLCYLHGKIVLHRLAKNEVSEQEIITKYKFKSKESFRKSDDGCISGIPDCIKIVRISNSLLQCKRIKIIILSKLIHFCLIFFILLFHVLFSLNTFFEKITYFSRKCIYIWNCELKALIITYYFWVSFRQMLLFTYNSKKWRRVAERLLSFHNIDASGSARRQQAEVIKPYLRRRTGFTVCKWKVQRIIPLEWEHRRKKRK